VDFSTGGAPLDIRDVTGPGDITDITEDHGVEPGVEPPQLPPAQATPKIRMPDVVSTPTARRKRPRPIRVDKTTVLSSKAIRRQLDDTAPIVRTRRQAARNREELRRRQREWAGGEVLLNEMEDLGGGLEGPLGDLFKDIMDTELPRDKLRRIEPIREVTDVSGFEQGDGVEPDDQTMEERRKKAQESLSTTRANITDVSDWHDMDQGPDYGAPSSPPISERASISGDRGFGGVVEPPIEPREMALVVINPNTHKMLTFLRREFRSSGEPLSFESMVGGRERFTVSRAFFELLVLKTGNFINLEQNAPFEDIKIYKTMNFNRQLKDASNDTNISISVIEPAGSSRIEVLG